MEDDIKRRIEERLKNLGITARAASLKAGGSPDLLRGLLRGKQRSFRGEHLPKIAEALGVTVAWLLTGQNNVSDEPDVTNTVPVIGYVGAGSETHYYDVAHSPGDYVPLPPGVPLKSIADLVAVEVRGDSLGSTFNGWLVYYDDVRTPADPTILGRLCVIGLPDGRVLVKRVHKAATPQRYNLVSHTEGIIEDVEVSWAALVRAMTPR